VKYPIKTIPPPGRDFSEDTFIKDIPEKVKNEIVVASYTYKIKCKHCKTCIKVFELGNYKKLLVTTNKELKTMRML